MDKPQKFALWSMQCRPGLPGGIIRDKLIGVHSSKVEKTKLVPQTPTRIIVVHVMAENVGPRKIRR